MPEGPTVAQFIKDALAAGCELLTIKDRRVLCRRGSPVRFVAVPDSDDMLLTQTVTENWYRTLVIPRSDTPPLDWEPSDDEQT
jgi:hypothetical protein